MGRNNDCFCGSGLKQKKCHPDIHPDSAVARLLKFYYRLDTDIAEYQKGREDQIACKKGCSSCCSDLFLISIPEFCLIMREIQKWNRSMLDILSYKTVKAWLAFEQASPEAAARFASVSHDKDSIIDDLNLAIEINHLPEPCPFLFDNICSIYKVRPMVCRIHGVVKSNGGDEENRACAMIDGCRDWQLLEPEYLSQEHAQFIWYKHAPQGETVYIRPMLLLRSLYNQFTNTRFGVSRIPFGEAIYLPYNRFVESLCHKS
jgi:Fe-S-cluster containining protein